MMHWIKFLSFYTYSRWEEDIGTSSDCSVLLNVILLVNTNGFEKMQDGDNNRTLTE